jgi:hypothetical protein
MKNTQLKIEEIFLVMGRGLILMPVLPFPTLRRFEPFNDQVSVHRREGSTKEYDAQFHLEHFRVVGSGGGWRAIAILPNASRADVPIDSKLLVSENALALIQGEAT